MKLWTKFKNLLGRRARVARLEEEMRYHIEQLTEENVARGLDRVEARRQAHLAFGNVLATREESEDALGWPSLESWAHDVRIAVRTLARRPAFSLNLILVLGLGLGVTTAAFTLVRAVMFEPLPVARPAELHAALDAQGEPFLLSAPSVQRLNENPAVAGRAIGYGSLNASVLRVGEAPSERVTVMFVTGNFFTALGVSPQVGRLLVDGDARVGAPQPVAVISDALWEKRFQRDAGVVGRAVRINGQDVTIIGVAARGFRGVALDEQADLWLPVGLHAPLRVGGNAWIVSDSDAVTLEQWTRLDNVAWLTLLVRTTDPAAAGAALLEAWQPQVAAVTRIITDPVAQRNYRTRAPRLEASPMGVSSVRKDFRSVGLTLTLLVGAVLLVTAANSATLLLLRLLGRSREFGVRMALGAGRGRLARALWIEGLVLTVAGAMLGAVIGYWLAPLLAQWLVPAATDLPGFDWTMLGALAGLAILLSAVLGGVPAWLSARLSPQAILQQRAFGAGGPLRLGRAMIVAQLAMSVMLVALALALALDLRRVLATAPGYARESVVQAFFYLSEADIPAKDQPAVLERLRVAALESPQVREVGFASSGPLSGSRSASGVYFRGEGVVQPRESVQQETIDEHYLSTLGLTLVRGRGFAVTDTESSPPVALITERLAREVFGHADPIGRKFGFGETADSADRTIIGIVGDARVNSVRGTPPAMFYMPLPQWRSEPTCLVLRVSGDAAAARTALQKKIAAAEPALMFTRWATLEERAQRSLRNDFAAMRLTAGFGGLALVLAIIGVFGALGYLVASRSREIAVRLAIGAEPAQVWRSVVRDAAMLGFFGAVIGGTLALMLPRLLGTWLMAGAKADGAAVALAVGAGLFAAFIGGLLPARRAAKVDPLTLLRAE